MYPKHKFLVSSHKIHKPEHWRLKDFLIGGRWDQLNYFIYVRAPKRKLLYLQGPGTGAYSGIFPGGAQHPLGHENPLKSIDFMLVQGGA